MEMKKALCLVVAMFLMFSIYSFAGTAPSSWAEKEIDTTMVSVMESLGVVMDYQRPITRKEFAILAVDSYFRLAGSKTEAVDVENPFTDVDEPMVLIAFGLGIVKGRTATTYDPNANISRQEMCLMLTRVIDKAKEEYNESSFALAAGSLQKYTDAGTVADWAKQAVEFSVSKGIMNGMSETTIGPLGDCTMEQALVLVNRMVKNFK